MPDRDTTKRMFTHMLNMMEQHDTMTISCGDPLMKLLKDVRELLNEQPEIIRCKDCKYYRAIPGYCAYDRIWQENKGHVWGMYCKPDWYCADGERRDDDA